MLHVLNGDSVRLGLEQSGIPGEVAVWADPLYEGPVPRGDDAAFRAARARFHGGESFSFDDALTLHRRWDAALARAATTDEVVLWFEHDLHDQLLLVRQLDWLSRNVPGRPGSLICIGAFDGVVPFHGLGQHDASQLASLFPTRLPVTTEQFRLGRTTWMAFTGSDPRALEHLLADDTSALPFLAAALVRLLEEFPEATTGLPRTERTTLEMLARRDRLSFVDLFRLQQTTEESPFMGDLTFRARLVDLARGGRPLLMLDPPNAGADFLGVGAAITDDGRRVMAGDVDWMSFASFDRWIGGSHLRAPRITWRWDRARRQLAPPA